MANRAAPTTMLTRDVERDVAALGFWGVVSGTFTVERALNLHREHSHVSALAAELRPVLTQLGARGVLDPRTFDPGFDADRRCRRCGVVHADSPVLRRMGPGACFRDAWGGPVRENPIGLRPRGRR